VGWAVDSQTTFIYGGEPDRNLPRYNDIWKLTTSYRVTYDCDSNDNPGIGFVCVNGTYVFDGTLELNSSSPIIVITGSATINGSLIITSPGTVLNFTQTGFLDVAVCVKFPPTDGSTTVTVVLTLQELELIRQNQTVQRDIINTPCVEGALPGVTISGDMSTANCQILSSETTRTPQGLAILFSPNDDPACAGDPNTTAPPVLWWIVLVVVGGVAVIAVAIMLSVPKLRRKVFPFMDRNSKTER
jgi:hypothetical protein